VRTAAAYRRLAQVSLALPALILLAPRPSLAFSFFWETEGSYVHQLGHLLFLMGMFFFILEIKSGELKGRPGFRSLVWSCWLFVWWNLDAVLGHTLDWSLSAPIITGTGLNRRLYMENWHTWAYYLTRITHFFLPVPAFYLFYRGLKKFLREAEGKSP
jgi:hypothetical protein